MVPENRLSPLVRLLIPLILLIAGVTSYHNSFTGEFLFDDHLRIIDNPQIRHLWPPWTVMAHSSRPLVELSLAVNYALGGFNVWGYHAFNLTIHLLAGLALLGLVRRMLESPKLRARHARAAPWLALAVALLWLLHPLQTESVAYIIQRAETLMGLFLLVTLYCGIRGAESAAHHARWYLAAVTACTLGMASKEVMVVAPLVMLLYDRVFLSGSFRAIFRQRWGLYAGLAATWLVLGVAVLTSRPEDTSGLVPGATWRYAITQFGVIVHYLRLAFWPHPQVFDYLWPLADSVSAVVPSALVVLSLLGATIWALVRLAWPGFWGAWFFLILAPTSSVLAIADAAVEHRMYLPLAAVVVLVVLGAHELAGSLPRRASPGLRRWLEVSLLVAGVAVLGHATVRRNEDFQSNLAMWSDVVAKRPLNPRAHTELGLALEKQGRINDAIAHYSEALRLKPDYAVAHNNLGNALSTQGKLEEAIAHYSEALRLKPDYAKAHNNLGNALARQGKLEDAVGRYREALRINPDYADAHNNLGAALARQGALDEAIAHFSEARRINPSSPDVYNNLGGALANQGKLQEAVALYADAIRLDPRNAAAHKNLAAVLAQQGKLKEAIAHYDEAVRTAPDAGAYYGLATVLARDGKTHEAVQYLEAALKLDPALQPARQALNDLTASGAK